MREWQASSYWAARPTVADDVLVRRKGQCSVKSMRRSATSKTNNANADATNHGHNGYGRLTERATNSLSCAGSLQTSTIQECDLR